VREKAKTRGVHPPPPPLYLAAAAVDLIPLPHNQLDFKGVVIFPPWMITSIIFFPQHPQGTGTLTYTKVYLRLQQTFKQHT
jgi:hypothetical protein